MNIKHVIISILLGAVVAFLTSLAQGATTFLQAHSTDIFSGGVSAFLHLAHKTTV